MSYGATRVHREISTVHRDERPRDPTGRIRSQKHGETLDIGRLTKAANGNATQILLLEAGRFGDAFFEARIQNLGGKYGIDADASAGPLGAELTRHLGDGAHRNAIRDMPAPESGDTCQRSDVHDAAPSRSQHPAARLLACAETAQHQIAPNL